MMSQKPFFLLVILKPQRKRKELTIMAAKNINAVEFENIRHGEKPVLVDFWAPWCGYCRRIGPAYEKVAEEQAALLEVVKLNIDEEPLIANREQIEVIPTLVLYRGGEAVASIVAPESKAAIDQFIRQHL